jgi:DNA repair protein RadC
MEKRDLADPSAALIDHRVGHRERLRERFRLAGADALHDYELLELALCMIIPRRDVKPLAMGLLAEFGGDLTVLFAASRERLMAVAGAGEQVADLLSIMGSFVNRTARQPLKQRDALSSWSALVTYCQRSMQGLGSEQFRVLFLDRKNRLIRDEVLGEGTVDHAPVYPREIMRRALELQASALILVHNHPSGDPSPSTADVEMTKLIVEAARTLEITVHDHLVVGRQGHASLRQLGLM